MRELTLSEIQKESLNILQDVHCFCLANGIRYSLAYGTLIGAVRHKGFIPWDDDIDIMMLRSDYEKFCSCYKSENYSLISFKNDSSCLVAYARVCDMKKTLVRNASWTSQSTGVWIDIFPIDQVVGDDVVFNAKYQMARRVWEKTMRHRELVTGPSSKYSRKMNFLVNLMNNLHLNWVNNLLGRRKVKKLIELATHDNAIDDSYRLCQLVCCDEDKRKCYNKNDFGAFVNLEFEGYYFCAVHAYDSVLRQDYGNYMELPPEEQRRPKQSSLSFLWRD